MSILFIPVSQHLTARSRSPSTFVLQHILFRFPFMSAPAGSIASPGSFKRSRGPRRTPPSTLTVFEHNPSHPPPAQKLGFEHGVNLGHCPIESLCAAVAEGSNASVFFTRFPALESHPISRTLLRFCSLDTTNHNAVPVSRSRALIRRLIKALWRFGGETICTATTWGVRCDSCVVACDAMHRQAFYQHLLAHWETATFELRLSLEPCSDFEHEYGYALNALLPFFQTALNSFEADLAVAESEAAATVAIKPTGPNHLFAFLLLFVFLHLLKLLVPYIPLTYLLLARTLL
uniref:C2H2-type domain-containing protein n=1 Tax=Mycena chlorophos TaxID=658473 RepID=A0ABQ0L828_MYCCL|nr:predicted protein [Mycena chlorophos]